MSDIETSQEQSEKPFLDKHPKDMPEMAYVIAFCTQYKEAVGNLIFPPEELENAIVRRKRSASTDLLERVQRYFLQNAMNVPRIIDGRYWASKLRKCLNKRISKKSSVFSRNPFDKWIDKKASILSRQPMDKSLYHKFSNFEKVMILKELVMLQFESSEKIQAMWNYRIAQDEKNKTQPVKVETLGLDSKGSSYYHFAGARVYRETHSCGKYIWESLTTTLQDLRDLASALDPNCSENEALLYKRISEELIPDIESKIRESKIKEQRGKKIKKKRGRKRKSRRSIRGPKTQKADVITDDSNDHSKVQSVDEQKIDKGKGVLREEQDQMAGGDENVPKFFVPGPEDLIKLNWSLNHIAFQEMEIFGYDSDSGLSECCDDCIMEVDGPSENVPIYE